MDNLYKYVCIACNFKTTNANHFIRHKQTIKHIKNTSVIEEQIYRCSLCNFETSNKECFERHNKSSKHLKNLETDCNSDYYIDEYGKHICLCGKEYKLKSSLINHRKKCSFFSDSSSSQDTTIEKKDANTMKIEQLEAAVVEMAAQQAAAQESIAKKDELMMEYIQKTSEAISEIAKQPKTITNIDNRKIDNRVSINVFLNDQCKDAMNLVDFVNTIQYRLEDLEHIGKNGYIEGVSRLMIEGLQKMDITKRPIHCTDSKRDSLYIKDNDEWAKEDPTGGQMKKAIRKIANKGVQKLPEWQENNPTFNNLKSNTHEKYMGICGNLMGGLDDEEDNKNFKKITKRIASEVIIDKDMTTAITNDK